MYSQNMIISINITIGKYNKRDFFVVFAASQLLVSLFRVPLNKVKMKSTQTHKEKKQAN